MGQNFYNIEDNKMFIEHIDNHNTGSRDPHEKECPPQNSLREKWLSLKIKIPLHVQQGHTTGLSERIFGH